MDEFKNVQTEHTRQVQKYDRLHKVLEHIKDLVQAFDNVAWKRMWRVTVSTICDINIIWSLNNDLKF